jgi:ABC-type bacteriocin/lantibiotic exporter with double-glycine peptidase domain
VNINSFHKGFRSRIHLILAMFSLLSDRQKRTYRFFVFWMLISSLIEILTLGILVTFLKAMTTPDLLTTSPWENTFLRIMGPASSTEITIIAECILVALFLLKNWFTYTMYASFNRYVFEIATALSQSKLQEYFSLDFLDVEKRNTSEYARQIIHVPIEFSQHVVLGSMVILSETLLVILLSIAVFLYNAGIFLLIIGFFLPFIALTRFVSTRKLKVVKKTIHSLSNNNSKVLADILNGYVDAKIYRKEKYFIYRYNGMQEALNNELALLNSVNILPSKLSEIFLISALVVILFISHGSGNTTGITTIAGVFVAFLYRAVPSINKILTLWSNAHTYTATITMLQPLATSDLPNTIRPDTETRRKFINTLKMKNISYKYSDREQQTLDNISMIIRKGDIIGIVGKSGSGKTTILNLFLRLLNTQGGNILLDESPAETISISSWQSLFAFVKQSPFLLHDTIEANIAFGEKSEDIDHGKILESLTLAGLNDFLVHLPNGVKTNIGERGKQLSGGQKQRLVIARALYKNAEIFIFDEATSELDDVSEMEIVETIRMLQKNGKTIIIASHRPSVLKPCNVIFELKKGKLILQPKRRNAKRKGMK